jgi:hypothetical protein
MGRWREGWQLSDEPFGGRPSEHPARHAAIVQGRQRAPWMRRGWVRVRVRVRRLNGHAGRLGCTFERPQVMGSCTACATTRSQRPWLCLDGCRAASYRERGGCGMDEHRRCRAGVWRRAGGSAPASQGTALTTSDQEHQRGRPCRLLDVADDARRAGRGRWTAGSAW